MAAVRAERHALTSLPGAPSGGRRASSSDGDGGGGGAADALSSPPPRLASGYESFRQLRGDSDSPPGPSGQQQRPASGSPRGGAAGGVGAQRVRDAMASVRDAATAAASLKALLSDAVFLDEEAFGNASALGLQAARLGLQARRIRELEATVSGLQAAVAQRDERLAAEAAARRQAQRAAAEAAEQLENNARVFELHHAELLRRSDEIQQLRERLGEPSGGGGGGGFG